jgi:uncharacterized protein (TIGR02246 family)
MQATTPRRCVSLRAGRSRQRLSLALQVVLAMATCVMCGTPPPPPGGEASAAEVEAAFKRFEEAWEREDVDAAANAFTPDAVVFDPVPPGRFDSGEGIRNWISGSFASLDQISISTSQLRVQTAGRVAWATTHYTFEAQQAGKPLRVEGDLTMVWVRQTDGSRRLSVFHASHLPPATGG